LWELGSSALISYVLLAPFQLILFGSSLHSGKELWIFAESEIFIKEIHG